MIDIGKVCMKIAGRDAGKVGVVVDILDDTYVLLDGEVRRRKCNILHLEPLGRNVQIKKNASHADVLKALGLKEEKKKAGKKKEKASRPRPMNVKKTYAAPKKEKKALVKKEVKPTVKKATK